MTEQEASECIEEIMNENLPERWKHEFGLGNAKTQNWLPYSYFTVKSKCYKTEGRVCEKKGHSCVRKIVAYTKWPKREAWRRAGRCIEKLVRVFGDGWEAYKLNTAPAEVRTGMKLLHSSESPDVCERCQKSKERVCGLVCDAGQFHETVSATKAMTAMLDLVTRVRSKSDFGSATVFLQKKTNGVPWW